MMIIDDVMIPCKIILSYDKSIVSSWLTCSIPYVWHILQS